MSSSIEIHKCNNCIVKAICHIKPQNYKDLILRDCISITLIFDCPYISYDESMKIFLLNGFIRVEDYFGYLLYHPDAFTLKKDKCKLINKISKHEINLIL